MMNECMDIGVAKMYDWGPDVSIVNAICTLR